VESTEFDTVVNVYGAFSTKEEAERYARRAFYLGREHWERKPVHYNNFSVAPWQLAKPEYR
jgi:hypothetical protein